MQYVIATIELLQECAKYWQSKTLCKIFCYSELIETDFTTWLWKTQTHRGANIVFAPGRTIPLPRHWWRQRLCSNAAHFLQMAVDLKHNRFNIRVYYVINAQHILKFFLCLNANLIVRLPLLVLAFFIYSILQLNIAYMLYW